MEQGVSGVRERKRGVKVSGLAPRGERIKIQEDRQGVFTGSGSERLNPDATIMQGFYSHRKWQQYDQHVHNQQEAHSHMYSH